MANFLIGFGALAIIVSAIMPVFDRLDHAIAARARHAASKIWDWVNRLSPRQIPSAGIGAFERGLEVCVDALVCEADRSPVLSPLVVALLSLILPLAALANAMLGGSPFLVSAYLAVVAMFVVLGWMDTMRQPSAVSRGLAMISALMWTCILPLYAVRSLTLHYLNSSIAIGFVALVLVAVLFYAALIGGWSLFRSGRRLGEMAALERASAFVLAGLPVFYVGYLAALILDGSEIAEGSNDWTSLAVVAIVTSVFMAAMGGILRTGYYRRGLYGTTVTLVAPFILALLAGALLEFSSGGPASAAILPLAFWCMILFATVATAAMRALWSFASLRARILRYPVGGLAIAAANVGCIAIAAGWIIG